MSAQSGAAPAPLPRLVVAALMALAAALAGGCALSVDGELPGIEVKKRGLAIPAVPREARPGEPVIGVASFFRPNDHLGLEPESYSSVRVNEVELSLKSGATDLSFLRSLTIGMSGLQAFMAGTAPIEVARYERPATAASVGPTLLLRPTPPPEVVEPWRDSTTVVTLQAQGDLPDEAWTAALTVRLSASLKY